MTGNRPKLLPDPGCVVRCVVYHMRTSSSSVSGTLACMYIYKVRASVDIINAVF
jgi:hypothetical protein